MDRGELSLSLIIRQVVPYVPSLSLPRFSFFGLLSVHRSGKVNANWRVTLKVGTRKWGKGRRHFAFHSLIFCYTVSTKGICNQRHPIMVCKLCIIMCFIFGSTCKLAWSSLDCELFIECFNFQLQGVILSFLQFLDSVMVMDIWHWKPQNQSDLTKDKMIQLKFLPGKLIPHMEIKVSYLGTVNAR